MYIFENVWQQDTSTKKEVISFWLQENAISSEEEAIKRSEQLIFVARDSDTNNIVGVCTSYVTYIQHLINNFYYYRSYITQEHRSNVLGTRLFLKSYDLLNKIHQEEKKTIGIMIELENKQLEKRNKAIWPESDFIFIGVNQKGNHMRVAYFDDACIS